jgi:Asp/Glu/Hydantoin racemase
MLGVIMLDTRFTRFPGDIGHAASHPGPVLFETVANATAARVVGGIAALTDLPSRTKALEPFAQAGIRLVASGATAITTSCGFLVSFQAELSALLPVPVLTSALCLLPEIAAMLPDGQAIGILTFDAESLGPMHLEAAGFTGSCVIEGLDHDCTFRQVVLEHPANDSNAMRESDVLAAADRLLAKTPNLGAVLLECTNFPPYRAALQQRMNRPVYDIWDIVKRLGAKSATASSSAASDPAGPAARRPPD